MCERLRDTLGVSERLLRPFSRHEGRDLSELLDYRFSATCQRDMSASTISTAVARASYRRRPAEIRPEKSVENPLLEPDVSAIQALLHAFLQCCAH